MTIQRYEIFNKVVELGNITKAGEELNMTQSGVSHALKSLEEEFDIKLLIRNRLGLKLTNEGRNVHEYTLQIMNLHYGLIQQVDTLKGLETGIVRVGSFASVTTKWLPEVLQKLAIFHPGIDIEIYEDDYENLEKAVCNGELDCCFTTASAHKKAEFIPLHKDKLYCIVSKDHDLAKQERMKIEDFEQYQIIKPKKGFDYEIEEFLATYDLNPKVKYEVSDDHSILALVAANHGINIRPELVIIDAPENIKALEFDVEANRIIGLAHTAWKSPATSLFITIVQELFQQDCYKLESPI